MVPVVSKAFFIMLYCILDCLHVSFKLCFYANRPMVRLINSSAFIISIFSLVLNPLLFGRSEYQDQPCLGFFTLRVLTLCSTEVCTIEKHPVLSITPVFFLHFLFYRLTSNCQSLMKSYATQRKEQHFYLSHVESSLPPFHLPKQFYFYLSVYSRACGCNR